MRIFEFPHVGTCRNRHVSTTIGCMDYGEALDRVEHQLFLLPLIINDAALL